MNEVFIRIWLTGLPASIPEFMLPKRARRQPAPDFTASESDEEWRPRAKRKRGNFCLKSKLWSSNVHNCKKKCYNASLCCVTAEQKIPQ
jgi:hypothetical protein